MRTLVPGSPTSASPRSPAAPVPASRANTPPGPATASSNAPSSSPRSPRCPTRSAGLATTANEPRAIYRALFPQTIDRLVIDSSVDPDKQGYDDFRSFSFAMEDRWPDLAKFGVDNGGTVHRSECFGSFRVVDRRGLTVLFTSKAPPYLDIQPTPADDAWLSAGPPTRTGAPR